MVEDKNKTKEESEDLCCADKNACDIRCAPKKKDSERGCSCEGCC